MTGCGGAARKPTKPRQAQPLSAGAYAHYLRGRVAMHEADFTGAIAHFRAASIAAPGEAPIRVALARALLRAGHKTRAVTVAEAAQRAFSDVVEVWLVSGRIYRAAGRPRDALRAYQRAVRLAPDEVAPYLRLGATWVALQRPDRAEQTYRQLLRQRPTLSARVGEKLFFQLLEAGARDEAIKLLGLLDRADRRVSTRITFGYLYLQVHARELALALARTLRSADPENGEARLLEAQATAELGRRSAAIKLLLAIPTGAQTYASARAMAGELLARQGELVRARSIIDGARALHRRSTELIVADATVLRLAGVPARARRVFTRAMAGRPRNTVLLYGAAELEAELGNASHAVRLAERVLAVDARHVEAMNFIGYSLADRGIQLDRAERLLRAAMAISPGNGYILDSFGWLLFRRGRLDAAEKVLRRASRLTPAEPEILWHLAELRIARRDRPGALALLRKARRLDPQGRVRARIKARIQALRSDKW